MLRCFISALTGYTKSIFLTDICVFLCSVLYKGCIILIISTVVGNNSYLATPAKRKTGDDAGVDGL